LKRRNPEVRISNVIVGSHIGVGYTKRHSRHEHEFARKGCHRVSLPLSQCRSTIAVTSRDDPIFVQARVHLGLMSQVITAAHQGA
jgi:hypothetical protein